MPMDRQFDPMHDGTSTTQNFKSGAPWWFLKREGEPLSQNMGPKMFVLCRSFKYRIGSTLNGGIGPQVIAKVASTHNILRESHKAPLLVHPCDPGDGGTIGPVLSKI